MPIESFAERAITEIELKLREPLKTLPNAPFWSVAEESSDDPLFRCMECSLSEARDVLCENMTRVGANRNSQHLFSSLQRRRPYSEWSAVLVCFHSSIALSLYRGWTWLGLNAVAFGTKETCALDMLSKEVRKNLRELLQPPDVHERLPFQKGVVEVLMFLSDLLTQRTEQIVRLPISIDEGRFEVTYRGQIYAITERQTKFLSDLDARRGKWVAGSVLKEHPSERIDRVKNTLPPPILALVQSHLRNGYRLNLPQ